MDSNFVTPESPRHLEVNVLKSKKEPNFVKDETVTSATVDDVDYQFA